MPGLADSVAPLFISPFPPFGDIFVGRVTLLLHAFLRPICILDPCLPGYGCVVRERVLLSVAPTHSFYPPGRGPPSTIGFLLSFVSFFLSVGGRVFHFPLFLSPGNVSLRSLPKFSFPLNEKRRLHPLLSLVRPPCRETDMMFCFFPLTSFRSFVPLLYPIPLIKREDFKRSDFFCRLFILSG